MRPPHDVPRSTGPERWPPLLLDLRRTARPDRARVAAYLGLTERPTGWAVYTEFLAAHRVWIASLDRLLAEAGVDAPRPLPDVADPLEVGAAPDAAGAGLPAPCTRAEALGYLYVFEAFRLGCSVLARRIRGRPEPSADPTPWSRLVAALGTVAPDERPAVVRAAREASRAWERRLAGPLAKLGMGSLFAEADAA